MFKKCEILKFYTNKEIIFRFALIYAQILLLIEYDTISERPVHPNHGVRVILDG